MFRSLTTSRPAVRRNRVAIRPRAEGLEARRLLSAGDLDPTFSGDGIALIAPSGGSKNQYAYAREVEILTDGKILVAGYDNGNFSLIRLNTNGSLDGSFGSGGRAATTKGSAGDMAIQSNGRIVLVGTVVNSAKGGTSDTDIAVARYNANGSLDTTFGGDGSVSTAISMVTSTSPGANKADWASSVAIQPTDQKILIGGSIYGGADYSNSVLVRYNTDGSLDSTFGQGGKLVTPIGVGEDVVNDVIALPDGRILAVGYATDATGRLSMYIARYNPNGTADVTFGTDGSGLVMTSIGATGNLNATTASVLPNGTILVTGQYGNSLNHDIVLARFTPAGTLDATFGGGTGYVLMDAGGNEYSRDMAVQPDGKIVVVGQTGTSTTGTNSFMARFLPDGTPDPSYGGAGFVVRHFSAAMDYLEGVAIQGGGEILAVGTSRTEAARSVTDNILVARFKGDSAALLASSVTANPIHRTLIAAQARPVLAQALAYWRSRGDDTNRLGRIDLAIAELGGNRLGEASGSTITLDDNAAGWGWNVGRGRMGSGRIDLLSVLKHEVGHLLGHDHAEGGVMAETLAPAARVKVVPAGVAAPTPHRLVIEAFRGRGRHSRAAARA